MDADRPRHALRAFDRAHVWHPYSSALAPGDPSLVESAEGVRLRLRDPDGTTHDVVDAMSSWWCAIHGYRSPSSTQPSAASSTPWPT